MTHAEDRDLVVAYIDSQGGWVEGRTLYRWMSARLGLTTRQGQHDLRALRLAGRVLRTKRGYSVLYGDGTVSGQLGRAWLEAQLAG